MASAASEAAIASLRGNARETAHVTQAAAPTAWLRAIPCSTIAVATLSLGPDMHRLR